MNNLARLYIQHMRDDYHSSASIPKKQAMKFVEREIDLVNAGISIPHYAKTVSQLFMGWCSEKNLYCIPANIFVSEFAYQKYIDFRQKASVKLDDVDDSERVFFTELQLCSVLFNTMRSSTPATEDQLVAAFKDSSSPLVCESWKSLNAAARLAVKLRVCQYYTEFGAGFKTNKSISEYDKLFVVYLRNATGMLQERRKMLKSAKGLEAERLKLNIKALEQEIHLLERNLTNAAVPK